MALEMIRESIDIERMVGEGSAQALVEGSVLVPGAGREEARILLADGQLTLGATEVQGDRVALEGNVVFNILYTLGEDQRIRSMEASCPFNHTLDVPGSGPRMKASVTGTLENVEAEFTSGRMALRAVTSLRAKVSMQSAVMCLTSLEGDDHIYEQHREIATVFTVGEGGVTLPITEEFELPDALEAVDPLLTRAQVSILDAQVGDDTVFVRGELTFEVWHASEMTERPVARTRHTIPFETDIEMNALSADARVALGEDQTPSVHAEVHGAVADLFVDEEEHRTLRLSANVKLQSHVLERRRMTVLRDAYIASDTGLEFECEKIDMLCGIRNLSGLDTFKATVTLPAGAPLMGTLLAAAARPSAIACEVGEGRVTIEGILDYTALYMPAGGGQPVSHHEEMPYRAVFDAELSDDSWTALRVEECDTIQITADRMEVKCLLRLEGTTWECQTNELGLDVKTFELPAASGGVVLAFAQPGDTLWSIAKRYRTSPETIAAYNANVSDPLPPGSKVLLYQRVKSVV